MRLLAAAPSGRPSSKEAVLAAVHQLNQARMQLVFRKPPPRDAAMSEPDGGEVYPPDSWPFPSAYGQSVEDAEKAAHESGGNLNTIQGTSGAATSISGDAPSSSPTIEDCDATLASQTEDFPAHPNHVALPSQPAAPVVDPAPPPHASLPVSQSDASMSDAAPRDTLSAIVADVEEKIVLMESSRSRDDIYQLISSVRKLRKVVSKRQLSPEDSSTGGGAPEDIFPPDMPDSSQFIPEAPADPIDSDDPLMSASVSALTDA